MSLTASEKDAIRSTWKKVSPQARELGSETLESLLIVYPFTHRFFMELGMTLDSVDIKTEGGKIMDVIGNAVKHMDDLAGNLSTSDLPAKDLWVDPKNFKPISGLPNQLLLNIMSLTASEKDAVRSTWKKVSPQARELGVETLERLLIVYPFTHRYFMKLGMTLDSVDIKTEGGKIMDVIGNAVKHMDDLAGNLSTSDLPAKDLLVDPKNFKMLSDTMQGVFADHYPDEFTPEVQGAWDKFLSNMSEILTSEDT